MKDRKPTNSTKPTEEEITLMLEEYNKELDTRKKKLRIIPSFVYDQRLDELINELKDKETLL